MPEINVQKEVAPFVVRAIKKAWDDLHLVPESLPDGVARPARWEDVDAFADLVVEEVLKDPQVVEVVFHMARGLMREAMIAK